MEEKNVNEEGVEVLNENETENVVNENNVSEAETLEVVSDILSNSEKQEVETLDETETTQLSDLEKAKAKLKEINSRAVKQEPIFKTIGKNLKEKLSNILALIYSSIGGVVCLLGLLFFTSQKNASSSEQVIDSCTIMQVFFGVFLGACVLVLLISIIMNIIRVKKDR